MAVFGIKVPVEFRLSRPSAPCGLSVQTDGLGLPLHRCLSLNLVQRGSRRTVVGQIVDSTRSSFRSPQRKPLFLGVCGGEVMKKFAIYIENSRENMS